MIWEEKNWAHFRAFEAALGTARLTRPQLQGARELHRARLAGGDVEAAASAAILATLDDEQRFGYEVFRRWATTFEQVQAGRTCSIDQPQVQDSLDVQVLR